MVKCAIFTFFNSTYSQLWKKVSNFAVSKEGIVPSCIKKLSIMRFLVWKKEVELLKELEFAVLETEWFDKNSNVLDLTATQFRDLVIELFDTVPLLNDKMEQWILCDLGTRIMQRVI